MLQKVTSRGTNEQPQLIDKTRTLRARFACNSWGLAVGAGASSSVSKSDDDDASLVMEDALAVTTAPFLWLPSNFVAGSVAVGS